MFEADGDKHGVNVYYSDAENDWTLEFYAPDQQDLHLQTYTGPRYPFQDAGHPGMDVYGDGRGSNTVSGQFTILQYDLNSTARSSDSPPSSSTIPRAVPTPCSARSSTTTRP